MRGDNSQKQFDMMTQMPIPRLVLMLGLPTTISMLVTNVYNMADTYFVSTLGTSASGATGVVFGLMAIIQAFGFMLGHGAGSNISRRLGGRKVEEAREFSATSFYLSLFCGSMILALGFLFQDPLMRLLGSTDSILPYARDYSTYILIAAPAMASSCVMNNILRYEGKATFAMFGLASGGILNIFGDYCFIKLMGMGITGAGLSTALSQYISAVILFLPFAKKIVQSSFAFRYFTRRFSVVKNIVMTGMPSLLRQGLGSISIMMLNQCAAPFGDAAIAAMSIVSRVINFLFCVGLGIGQGFQPVSSFNYGAKKYSRVRESVYFTLLCSVGFLSCMAALGAVFAHPVVQMFRDDPAVVSIGVFALRMQCISLVFLPVSVIANMLFQSIGKNGAAILLSSARSGVFFIPTLLILSKCLGLPGLQMSQMVADILSSALAVPFLIQFMKNLPEDDTEH